MFNELAPVGGCQTFLDFTEKPRVIINKALDGFVYKRLCVTAMLCSQPVELGL